MTCIPGTETQILVYHVNQKPDVVYQWDVKRKKLLKTYDLGDGFNCEGIDVSPDGRFTVISCDRSYNFDTGRDFATEALLVDNRNEKVVRNIVIPKLELISDVQFSTNSEAFLINLTYPHKTLAFSTSGEPIQDYNVAEYQYRTTQKVWEVGNSKGAEPCHRRHILPQ